MRKHLVAARDEYVPACRRHAGARRRESRKPCSGSKPLLAKDSVDRVEMRDPNKRYHIMTTRSCRRSRPRFHLGRLLQSVGAPGSTPLNVSQPDFIKQLARVFTASARFAGRPTSSSMLLRAQPPNCCPQAFEEENFEFLAALLDRRQEGAAAPVSLRRWSIARWATFSARSTWKRLSARMRARRSRNS